MRKSRQRDLKSAHKSGIVQSLAEKTLQLEFIIKGAEQDLELTTIFMFNTYSSIHRSICRIKKLLGVLITEIGSVCKNK